MKALVTGASSGIGRDVARVLAERGYGLILTARRAERLEELREELTVPVRIVPADLSQERGCFALYDAVKDEPVDVLVNCAGFGVFGPFDESDLRREIQMIDTDVKAVHILTKLFYRRMKARGAGYIMNVASAAAFQPGPLLAGYYAAKAYVLRLTLALYEELRRDGSGVHICALCPGPVRTEFDSVADVRFSVRGLDSRRVAEYAVRRMFAGKLVIVPGVLMKCTRFLVRLLPEKAVLRAAYRMQKRKKGRG